MELRMEYLVPLLGVLAFISWQLSRVVPNQRPLSPLPRRIAAFVAAVSAVGATVAGCLALPIWQGH